jgi:hypothetical protein
MVRFTSLEHIILTRAVRHDKQRRCPRRTTAAGNGDCSWHLRQCRLTPELLQIRGHDRPSEGLRPPWRVEPDLERDRDSRQHATKDKFPWPAQ